MSILDEFHIGDTVDIDDGIIGVVVFNSVLSEWSEEFPQTIGLQRITGD